MVVREPDTESIRLIARIAKQTGDVASLSAADIRLLALAHTLEVQKHGNSHLRSDMAEVCLISNAALLLCIHVMICGVASLTPIFIFLK